jgi:hypothetical protein
MTYLEYGGFVYPLSVDVGLCVPGAGRDGDDAFSVSDDGVPGLDVRSKQLEGLSGPVG